MNFRNNIFTVFALLSEQEGHYIRDKICETGKKIVVGIIRLKISVVYDTNNVSRFQSLNTYLIFTSPNDHFPLKYSKFSTRIDNCFY